MTRPLAPHGTTARARGRTTGTPCFCGPCREVQRRYDKRRRLLGGRNEPLRTPAAPVAAHLRALLDGGHSWPQLTAATGVSPSTISRLLSGEQAMMRVDVARRILAVPLTPIATHRPVDATGSIRRVRALLAVGHKSCDLAAESGVERSVFSDIVNGRVTRVRGTTAARVADVFERLSMRTGTSVRNIRRALREGWAPPLAWDEDIDDPAAVPRGVAAWERGAA